VSNPPGVVELALVVDVALGPAEVGPAFPVALGPGIEPVYVAFKNDSADKILEGIGAIVAPILEQPEVRPGPSNKSVFGMLNAISHQSHLGADQVSGRSSR
jgi:hypothetical protein